MPAGPGGLDQFYGQKVEWGACSDGDTVGFKCSTVRVPMDYDNPQGETIDLALKMRPAEGEAIGSLLFNPGGPGGSGVEYIPNIELMFTDNLLSSYDVVGFDPRGVGKSKPVLCRNAAELDRDNSETIDTLTPAGREEHSAKVSALGKQCLEKSGEIAKHVDSLSTVRDMDIMRAALGRAKLDFFGYSYGTFIGALYAENFPANVGRFVLDAAMDPGLNIGAVCAGQALGFQRSIEEYVRDCQANAGSCPLPGNVEDGVKTLRTFLDSLEAAPLKTNDPARPLTTALATTAVMGAQYNTQTWANLTKGLSQALNAGNGTQLLAFADAYNERNADGTYASNMSDAFTAINFLDYYATGTLADWDAQAAQLKETTPTWWKDFSYCEVGQQAWPIESKRTRTPVTASGSAPILVVGTTGDPATPYEWSVSLAKQLEAGRLLTWEGWGHTAYSRSGSKCVSGVVDTYLLTGTIPEDEADLKC